MFVCLPRKNHLQRLTKAAARGPVVCRKRSEFQCRLALSSIDILYGRPANQCGAGRAQCGRLQQETKSTEPTSGRRQTRWSTRANLKINRLRQRVGLKER